MTEKHSSACPIVIMGGFAGPALIYAGMRDALAEISGQSVYIVPTQSLDWLPSVAPLGWLYLLGKLRRTVQRAARASTTAQVTLIGHSAGGVLARFLLTPQPLLGRVYDERDRIKALITLGSPHYNQHWQHGGMMSHWVQQRSPDTPSSGRVGYTCVTGKLIQGDAQGSARQRYAYRQYKGIGGDGQAWGDGLIPVDAALLQGAHHLVLDGVAHFAGFGGPWYGDPQIVPLWWPS
ncbi:MAG: esterase [Anaerolineae bacterium]|nr:esterase [Anaerolineae bacterium]